MTSTIERIAPAPRNEAAEWGITREQLDACLPGSTFTQRPDLGRRTRVKQHDGMWDRYEHSEDRPDGHERTGANLSTLDRYRWDLLILPLAVGEHPTHQAQIDALPVGSTIVLNSTPQSPWVKCEDDWHIRGNSTALRGGSLLGERWTVTRIGPPDATPEATQPETETPMTSTITIRPDMTIADRHVLPFPRPGQPLETVDQLDALPAGTIISYLNTSDEGAWTKAANGLWSYPGEDDQPSTNFALSEDFGVISIPDLTPEQIHALPVGSIIWAEPSSTDRHEYTGRWERQPWNGVDENATGHNRQTWLRAGTTGGTGNNGIMFVDRGTYRVAAVWLLYVPGPEVAEEAVPSGSAGTSVTVGTGAVIEGMLLSQNEHSPTFLVYAVERTEEALRWFTVEFHDDGYRLDSRTGPPARDWVLHTQTVLHQVAGEWATAQRALEQARGEAEAVAAEREQRVAAEEERDRLTRRIEALNRELLSSVGNGDLDGDEVRNVLESYTDIGMTPPPQDYSVTFEATFRFTRSASASDGEQAAELAREAAAFTEGISYNCHGEDMTLLDLTVREVD